MKVPRFYCPQLAPPRIELDEAEARHARLSLRLRPGDAVEVFDGCGGLAVGRIAADERAARVAGRKAAAQTLSVDVERVRRDPPPVHALTLLVGGCKGDRLLWLIEKCTELGVAGFVLVAFERSVVLPGTGHLEKLRRSALEACKQCGRTWLPKIERAASLDEALAGIAPGNAVLLADPNAEAHETVAEALRRVRTAGGGGAAALIGPEGGISTDEAARILRHGAIAVRLGAHVLRVETAAVALAAAWAVG